MMSFAGMQPMVIWAFPTILKDSPPKKWRSYKEPMESHPQLIILFRLLNYEDLET